MRRVQLASLLPNWLLGKAARRWDTLGAFEGSVEGSAFWLNAMYWKWVRRDKRIHREELKYGDPYNL